MSIIKSTESSKQLKGKSINFFGSGFDKTNDTSYDLDKIRFHFESKIPDGKIALKYKDFEQIKIINDADYKSSDQGGTYTQMLELVVSGLGYDVDNQEYIAATSESPSILNYMDCQACVMNDSNVKTKIKCQYYLNPLG